MSSNHEDLEAGFKSLASFLQKIAETDDVLTLESEIYKYCAMLVYGHGLVYYMAAIPTKEQRLKSLEEFKIEFLKILENAKNGTVSILGALPLINGPKGDA